MAGYSGKPLAAKLGLKAGMKAPLLGAPKGYAKALEGGWRFGKPSSGMDFIQVFASAGSGLPGLLARLRASLAPSGMLWLSWPKQGSALRGDLGEAQVRALGLAAGLVDVKVCAVDDDWSALKFVIPVSSRPSSRPAKASGSRGA
jgi:hypothetical protein